MNMTDDDNNLPFYRDVDGFRIPGCFSEENYRSGLTYRPRDDDLFIVTFPKCGTTWVQNIVACICRDGKPFSTALEFFTQTPFLELTGAAGVETMKRPGGIKVHLPFHRTPWSTDAKYIFVARNPKDCCVSFYNHTKNIPAYNFTDGKFDDFFELFIEGKTDFGEYFDTLLSWYEHRNDPNVLFITYEQLKKDNLKYVLKIAEFMGEKYKEALEGDEKMLHDVIEHSSFKFMKETLNQQLAELTQLPKEMILNNPDLPQGIKDLFGQGDIFSNDPNNVGFIRKGIVGDWKNYFSEEQSKRLEDKFREKTEGTELEDLWTDDM